MCMKSIYRIAMHPVYLVTCQMMVSFTEAIFWKICLLILCHVQNSLLQFTPASNSSGTTSALGDSASEGLLQCLVSGSTTSIFLPLQGQIQINNNDVFSAASSVLGFPASIRTEAFNIALRSSYQTTEGSSNEGRSNTLKSGTGRPIDDLNVLTAGPRGPVLLQDTLFIEATASFNREKIPNRVVDVKGNGAFGYFEVTDDITLYTKAKLFSELGKRTPVAARFSIGASELGSADTIRDIRGFAVKFYTEEGNWDLLGLNLPVFAIRDPFLFPSFVRANRGRNPDSNLQNPNKFWDFYSLKPETMPFLLFLFSDQGIPESYRHINGNSLNTFQLVNESKEVVFCRFTLVTDQGIQNILPERARELVVSEPDYHGRDLYNAIDSGNYPTWTLCIQVMSPEEMTVSSFNPLDATKIWPQSEYPLIKVGKLVLNSNPTNHFAEIEQLAFSPGNLVPGIEPSQDKTLQGRLFAYPDTQRHRLGGNFLQIPVNYPFRSQPRNYDRNGFATVTNNGDGAPDYFPNSYGGPVGDPNAAETTLPVYGYVARYNNSDEDNFSQAGVFYRNTLNEEERVRLVSNIVESLGTAEIFIQERQIENFRRTDPDLGERVRIALQES